MPDDTVSILCAAHAAERALSVDAAVDGEGDLSPVRLYSLLYAKVYGRSPTPRELGRPRLIRILAHLQQFCAAEGLDLATWLAAQLYCMRDAVQRLRFRGRPLGFQPNMLAGANARQRYNDYIQRMTRRMKRAEADSMEPGTALMALRSLLLEGEVAVGAYIVAGALGGCRVSLQDAIQRALPPAEWRVIFVRDEGSVGLRWRLRLGPDLLDKVKRAVRLRAAVIVLDRLRFGLSANLVVTDGWDWQSLGRVASEALRVRPKQSIQSKGRGGVVWRAGA
jgi:hypothetical protein